MLLKFRLKVGKFLLFKYFYCYLKLRIDNFWEKQFRYAMLLGF